MLSHPTYVPLDAHVLRPSPSPARALRTRRVPRLLFFSPEVVEVAHERASERPPRSPATTKQQRTPSQAAPSQRTRAICLSSRRRLPQEIGQVERSPSLRARYPVTDGRIALLRCGSLAEYVGARSDGVIGDLGRSKPMGGTR